MMSRNPLFYLEDMIAHGEKIAWLIEGYDEASFLADERTVLAVTRCFEVMGEAANKIPSEIQASFPAIPWAQIIAFRNFLIHEYLGVSLERVWASASVALPQTLPHFQAMHHALSSPS